jgi:hypothetical protein
MNGSINAAMESGRLLANLITESSSKSKTQEEDVIIYKRNRLI